MSQQSEDEAIDTNHENIVQAYLQANHGSLCARGLQLNSEVLADQDIAPAIQPALALPQLQRRDLAYLLLLSLEPANLQHVLTAIQPLRTFDLVGLLPIELSRLVLIYLQPKELVACELVCKTWRTRARDSLVWRKVYCEAGYHVDTEAVNWWCGYGDHSISQHLFVDEGLADLAQPANASWTPPPKSLCLSGVSKIHQAQDGRPQIDFKHLYSLQVKAACNMRQGIFRVHEIRSPDRPHRSHSPPMYPDPPPTSVFHHDSIYCFQFLGNRLIAGGRNVDASPPQVIEWDLSTGQIMQVFAGHQASVLTLQFEAGLTNALVTGSSDGSLIVWDLDTATPRTEIAAHTKSVLNLHFDSQANTLVTASKGSSSLLCSRTTAVVVVMLTAAYLAFGQIKRPRFGQCPTGRWCTR